MTQFIEFINNHIWLSTAWLVVLALVIWIEKRRGSKQVSPAIATQMINKEKATVLDIRPTKEWQTGHITGAKHIPLSELEKRIAELSTLKSKPIIISCSLGHSANTAAKLLHKHEFTNVQRLSGGMSEWKAQSLPVVRS